MHLMHVGFPGDSALGRIKSSHPFLALPLLQGLADHVACPHTLLCVLSRLSQLHSSRQRSTNLTGSHAPSQHVHPDVCLLSMGPPETHLHSAAVDD